MEFYVGNRDVCIDIASVLFFPSSKAAAYIRPQQTPGVGGAVVLAVPRRTEYKTFLWYVDSITLFRP